MSLKRGENGNSEIKNIKIRSIPLSFSLSFIVDLFIFASIYLACSHKVGGGGGDAIKIYFLACNVISCIKEMYVARKKKCLLMLRDSIMSIFTKFVILKKSTGTII